MEQNINNTQVNNSEINNNEDYRNAEEMITKHNEAYPDKNESHFIISVTGMKGKYYTLYYFSKPVADFGKANPYMYRQNLSQSFSEAVKKVLDFDPRVRIETIPESELLEKIKRYKADTFKSGKHQGKTFEQVYNEDPQYILWMYEQLRKESQIQKRLPWGGTYYLSNKQMEMYQGLEPYVKTYHEEQIKKRQETIPSHYITEPSVKNIKFVITHVPVVRGGMYGQYVEIRGRKDDFYFIFNAKYTEEMTEEYLNTLKGTTASIKSAKTNPMEIYGVKYNRLNYIKGLEFKVE